MDYKNQEKFALQVAQLVKEVADYTKGLEKEKKEFEKIASRNAEQEENLQALREKINLFKNKSKTHYPQQMYISQLNYLFGGVSRSYQHVNQDSKMRFEVLKKEFEKLKAF